MNSITLAVFATAVFVGPLAWAMGNSQGKDAAFRKTHIVQMVVSEECQVEIEAAWKIEAEIQELISEQPDPR